LRGDPIPQKKSDRGDESSPEREQRAKYFDWCSARIADRFVSLSVQEIYALADSASPSADEDRSFQVVMERATEVLAARTELPTFEEWLASYRADPARYEADMIGFWRDLQEDPDK
jgi:hypothetical protein